MKKKLSILPPTRQTKSPIRSPGFLKWLGKKRKKKKWRKKVLQRFFEIKNLAVKRNAFARLYVFGKMRQVQSGRGWKTVTNNFLDVKGIEPPFVIRKWFFEDAIL